MKSKFFVLSSTVIFLFLVSSVYAALTVSVSLPSKSLTENEQVTVSVTVANTAGSSTESNIVTSLSSGSSWFSVVTDCSTLNSLNGGASGTSTCIIKPASTGSDLTLTASSTSQGGTTGSGSTSGINVASQSSSLTASITAASSVAVSSVFYVGTTVAAPSSNDVVNARATISRSGQCEIDTSSVPSQQSLGNITKGTTKSVTNWKLSSSSASGTCTVTVSVVSDVGGSASLSKAITVGSGSGSDSSGTSGTSGGTSGTGAGGDSASKAKVLAGEKEAIITIPSITANSSSNFSIFSPQLAISEMTIKVINTVSNVKITATKLDARPASLTSYPSGVVNQYMTIEKVNISEADIKEVKIGFKVEKTWLDERKVNGSTISLYRYLDDRWNKLQTSKTVEDSTSISYEAISPGLSIFAISGELKAGADQQTPGSAEGTEGITPEKIAEGIKSSWSTILMILFAIVILVFVVVYALKSKSKIKFMPKQMTTKPKKRAR